MEKRSIDLHFTGTIGGRAYFLIGALLFAIKFAIDHLVAKLVFDRPWTPIDYVAPGVNLPALMRGGAERWFYAVMILIALPFTFIGLVLTVKRLRSAGLSMWLVLLFFVPIINLLYFVVLALMPAKRASAVEPETAPPAPPKSTGPSFVLDYGRDDVARTGLPSLFPESDFASAIVAIIVPIPLVAGLTLLATMVLRDYGFGLFLGMPFVLGLTSSLVHGMRKRRRFGQCMGVAFVSYLAGSVALLVFGIEGAGCLIMLLPLGLPVALMGAALGYACQGQDLSLDASRRIIGVMFAVLPALMGAESVASIPAPLVEVTSSIEIDAPPAVVWRNVVDFPPLPEPREWIFRAGVAYPRRATINGAGPGAIRYCVFSTGAFVEPIEIWSAPRLLKFSVTSNPPPMRERSPWRIHPPHLDGFLVSEAGQFRLIELPDGRTRLEGTTWYRHRMWPASYWRLWSDFLIHKIHLRVLNHVKALSEQAA